MFRLRGRRRGLLRGGGGVRCEGRILCVGNQCTCIRTANSTGLDSRTGLLSGIT